MYELRIYSVLFVMKMKKDAKLEEELTCHFKTGMRNLSKFDSSTKKSQNLHFNGLVLTKVYNIWAKKITEELYLMALRIDAKFEGKLICAF